jgi:citrate synthase
MAPSATIVEDSAITFPIEAPPQTLSVTDNRTGKQYSIPIEHNAISAKHFKNIKTESEDETAPADQSQHGIRLFDPGFNNTAVAESRITYVLVSPLPDALYLY